ncbi:MAG TPA: tRNA (adenosine(37)-N6)-dimethylallyltransferase MiaA [Rhodospirillales bacterium]|nr:tRNA (adenosine(37)-N6)-dimethylallyltransferase MiaA [Rhodospirillales bacterium]
MVSRILFIGGTTASGKSELAVAVARRAGALVVNADAQQLYRDLPILTARPGPAEEARAEHRLYGLLPPEAATSAGRWLELVLPVLRQAEGEGRPVVLVGGTGLYMKCLLEGLAPIPPIPPEIRAHFRSLALPAPELHRMLAARDPVTAARLRPGDRQRILRALEVLETTGRPLAELQRATVPPLDLGGRVRGIALLPPRERLLERIVRRLDAMLAAGALEELAALHARRPELEELPIARVHGCREFLAFLAGRATREWARQRTIEVTRRYAKRQRTFFRHQLPAFALHEATGASLPDLARELGDWLLGRDGASC